MIVCNEKCDKDNLPWDILFIVGLVFAFLAAAGCAKKGKVTHTLSGQPITISNSIPSDLRICRDTNGVIDWRTHK
jgi:hypothetical protein